MAVPSGGGRPQGRDVWPVLGLTRPGDPRGGVGPTTMLMRVCDSLVGPLRMTAATVGLAATTGAEALAASSDAVARVLARLEFDLGEGPARQAYDLGRPVVVSDMAGPEAHGWPGYASAAREAGIWAQYAFPLQQGAVRFGVLVGYQDAPRRLSATELDDCLVCAEAATDVLLQSAGAQDDGRLDPDLATSLGFRAEVYQAQGMVAVALGVSLAEALARLRATAFQADRDLTELAQDVLAGRLTIPHDEDD